MLKKPLHDEYPAYYENYIGLVPDGELTDILNTQIQDMITLFSSVDETQANYRYAENKWTLKEVIGHIADTERIMSYRLLRIARGDQTPLSGYDDEQYVREASIHSRSLSDLLEELVAVRYSTVSLIKGLNENTWPRKGIANNGEITVRALANIIAGHELHHVKIIKEKYLKR
ncbi:DinB family protein [Paenisporosarcina sp. FSL H8-0542]|uniref:DinB family protein n=1 Tax=Paenisporosarcina sp. FSL H8-0542 TaxID=2921401 RepID=UPI003159BBC2